MAASAISASSVATVVEDLVADRSIALKVCLIILNVAHIVSNWVIIAIFIGTQDQKYSALEIPISLAFFLIGCYFIPAVTNGVIYFLRWKRSSPSNRQRMEEENKQAWVCLRITLTLLGVPTVGRYIETIFVSAKLEKLEKQHMQPSISAQKEFIQNNQLPISRLGGSVSGFESNVRGARSSKFGAGGGVTSTISGISQQSSVNGGLSENVYQKVRRARRQYKRCEHDGALMALVAGGAGGGPMAVALLYLYFSRLGKLEVPVSTAAILIVAFVFNILWLSATLSQFYPARHVQNEAEFERGIRANSFAALILVFLAHLVQTTLRIIILAIFALYYYAYVLIPIFVQWVVGAMLFIIYRCYMQPKTVGARASQVARARCTSILSAWYYGFVGIFDFVNGNEGKTRLRYLIYYVFYYAENIIMLVLWNIQYPKTFITFQVAFVASILCLFWVGFLFLQLYLYCFSYSPYGTSVVGLFCRNKSRDNDDENGSRSYHGASRYSEEIRDAAFGVQLMETSMPVQSRSRMSGYGGDANSRLSSNVNRPGTGRVQPPSMLSSKSPPSILSNIPSNQNKPPRNVHLPPIPQNNPKYKPSSKLPTQHETSSSDDDDEEEDLPVYSPKIKATPLRPASSQPELNQDPRGNGTDLSSMSRTTSPPTDSIDIKGKFKANYYHQPPVMKQQSQNNSQLDPKLVRSMDDLSPRGSALQQPLPKLTPIANPSACKTRPISTGNRSSNPPRGNERIAAPPKHNQTTRIGAPPQQKRHKSPHRIQ